MGGIAKGQIVREIDALGGTAVLLRIEAPSSLKMLNRSKGPAMWSPRVQSDRDVCAHWRELLEKNSNLDFYQEMVEDQIVEGGTVTNTTSFGSKHSPKLWY